jgi:glycosylphosphatidylinositol transamidase
VYDGINGQLPNLDLINTVTVIGTDYMAIGTTIQRMWKHDDSYEERLKAMLHGMLVQGLGRGSGPHSCFIPYHVDAITLQTVGDGWHDEMTLGRLVESTFRSLNNLLEHLHQSFFFYLLLHARRFVSIGTYLPSAMLVAINFTIMSIALWVQSGRPASADESKTSSATAEVAEKDNQADITILEHRGMVTVIPKKLLATSERSLLLPLFFVLGAHLLGITPLYLIHGASADVSLEFHFTLRLPANHLKSINSTFLKTAFSTQITPYLAASFLTNNKLMTPQAKTLIPCISLLLLGIALSTLSTLNFSLGLIVGLASTPLGLTQAPLLLPVSSKARASATITIRTVLSLLLLHLVHPTTIVYLASHFLTSAGFGDVKDVMLLASEAWTIQGTYTALVVWLVWWPAWFVGTTVVSSALFESAALRGGESRELKIQGKKEAEGKDVVPEVLAQSTGEDKRIYVKSVPKPEVEGGARGIWNG